VIFGTHRGRSRLSLSRFLGRRHRASGSRGPAAAQPVIAALVAFALIMVGWTFLPSGCATTPRAGEAAFVRKGDEIVVCGQYFHTGAPVVLWTDPAGYDAYRVERRFGPIEKSTWEFIAKDGTGPETPNRYSVRKAGLADDEIQRVRGGGWDLPLLQRQVDQFVLHYDVCGVSRQCFRVLHDMRGLSVHFMLDIDGTIYQTLDLKERAWHATSSNDRSIGIEIANMGAYASGEKNPFSRWYAIDENGPYITIPEDLGSGGVRTPSFVGRPDRPMLIAGQIQGRMLSQYDLTPQQYESLEKLTAALCAVFPNLRPDCPRDVAGNVITTKLDDASLKNYTGILGHFHVQDDKVDPGPALQWDRITRAAKRGAASAPR